MTLLCGVLTFVGSPVGAISLTPSSPVNAAASSYDIQLAASTSTLVRCVRIEFDSAWDGSGGAPDGMNIDSLTVDTGVSDVLPTFSGWAVTKNSATGVVTISNAGGAVPNGGNRHIKLDGIVNPSASASYHVLLDTYSNNNCSSGVVEHFTVPFVINGAVSVGLVVDPALTFGVTGRATTCNGQAPDVFSPDSTSNFVTMGRIDKTITGGGAQDLTVTTNAANGFSVSVRAPQSPNAMNDGNGNVISDIDSTHAAPGSPPVSGQAGFGYTADSAGFGGNQFAKLTTSDESVLTAAPGVMTRSGCVGYQVAAGDDTVPGAYVATVEYTAIALF